MIEIFHISSDRKVCVRLSPEFKYEDKFRFYNYQITMLSTSRKILMIALFIVLALSLNFDPNYSHSDFMRHYKKTYSEEERAAHETAFKKNYAELLKLKREGKDVIINSRLDWTQEEIKKFFNYRPENMRIKPSSRPLTNGALFSSPNAFDWRAYDRVTSVKDQGGCGSCWAFSSTAQYESKLAIATKGQFYDLAEQYAVQCETNSSGCDGGNPYYALQLLQSTGAPLESSYPYDYISSYPNICTNETGRVKINQSVNNVTFYYYENLTVEQMEQDLVNNGPYNVGVYASDFNFLYAGSSGQIFCFPATSVNHAILLVGYNTTHWFVKNSWGTGWGHNGYGYITKSTANDCNIRQYVVQMHVNYGFSPTQPDTLNITVTMSDSSNDGWNGNVLAFWQDNTIVGTFQYNSNSGNSTESTNVTYIVVKGYSEVHIVVLQLGTKTNEIGFVIKAPNGTIIFQRNSGTAFGALTVFSTFCPIEGCPQTYWLNITMTDSFGDGWNGNVLGFKQNRTIVGVFGNTFTTGSTSSPIYLTVIKNLKAQIVVTQLGNKTNQVGFIVKAANGTIIFQRGVGSSFTTTTYFTIFCPAGGCPNTLDLSITLSDSAGNGWNGTVLAIKQNNTVIGTFGSNFTSGSASQATQITVQGDLEAQVVVYGMGLNTFEIGFMIKAPNRSLIHQRYSGSAFPSGYIFSVFCPVGGCPASSYTTLNVNMNDSYGDGWNSNILGIRQSNVLLGYFGNTFLSGTTRGPIPIIVKNNIPAQIVVFQLGTKTNQIGFNIKSPNGTTLYQRSNGTTFKAASTFSIFCPGGGCMNLITLTVTMTDSYGDGWNSNILAFQQLNENNAIVGSFGNTFSSGTTTSPVSITVLSNFQTRIIVNQLGTKSNEIGFIVRGVNGTIIHQRNSGNSFYSYTVFKTFCPVGLCPNLNASFITISMTDLTGDGWNGNVISVIQNNSVIGTFGRNFVAGYIGEPVSFLVQGNITVLIAVNQIGSSTQTIGFVIKSSNGTTVYQRTPGATFDISTAFASFCLLGGCPIPTILNLTITITDSYGDGWNGNVLGIKQNDDIVGTFGGEFMSGYTGAPVNVVVQGNIHARVVVVNLGVFSEQIGFIIKSQNGTKIYQKKSGTRFLSTSIFLTFCPIGSCPATYSTLNITMSDDFGDGWNGNILAIMQGDYIVGIFGEEFQDGEESGPVYVEVQGAVNARIVVYTLGYFSSEVGFIVKARNGTTLHERLPGDSFSSKKIFSQFCLFGGCPPTPNITYSLTLTDSYGDGWQGTILAFKIGQTLLHTFTLDNGSYSGPIELEFIKNVVVRVTVHVLGNYTTQVGFVLRNGLGNTVFRWYYGVKFFANTLLGEFCAECVNSSLAATLKDQLQLRKQDSGSGTAQTEPKTIETENRNYLIATYVMAPLLLLSLLMLIVLSVHNYKLRKQLSSSKSDSDPEPEPEQKKSSQVDFSQQSGESVKKIQEDV